MNRRRYLALTGTVAATALAGCTSEESTDTDTGGSGGGGADDGADDGGGSTDSGGGSTSTSGGSSNSSGGGSDQSEPPVKLLEHDTYEGDVTNGVEGVAQNTTDGVIDYAEIKVVFLDGEGVQIGEGLDNVTELAAGRKFEFDCMFTGDDWSAVSDYEIEASDSPF